MQIIRGVQNFPETFRGAVVTIGNFDGVHLGHQAVFQTLRALAGQHGAKAVAISFEPHPKRLLLPISAPARITGLRGKVRWMGRHGVDGLFLIRFTRDVAALGPDRFVDRFLVGALQVREVLVGFNFRFGAGGKGTYPLLQELGARHGFGVHRQEACQLEGKTISSTRVRECVQAGDFAMAERLLGRPFEVEGRVVHGRSRGRGLGFPTANFRLEGLLHPPPGVYVVEVLVDEVWLPAVANLGDNPTFGGEGLRLEVHLLVTCGDIYRRVLRICFRKRLRDEIHFPDAGALQARIVRDVAEARAWFAADPHPMPKDRGHEEEDLTSTGRGIQKQ
ncbi:MAG: bifunctional riboflavin kinase/FAD synthetase [Magnetococcales bacterium]|nr:bifunctional riboflavin kinase/FAD synthetase [Magnetococcales bacterium]MBF0321707.1 bifunctional riboflavin kinase/FAD synthetase [Magnetococcales bacterium]